MSGVTRSVMKIVNLLRTHGLACFSWILTTTHINKAGFVNLDIRTGDARLIDLFAAPFLLPPACHFRIDDWVPPDAPREMVLFDRQQVAEALVRMEQAIRAERIQAPSA